MKTPRPFNTLARMGDCRHDGKEPRIRRREHLVRVDSGTINRSIYRIAILDEAGRRRVLLEGIDSDMARFNDVIADPEGRVYAGTIGKTRESGGLYRVERDLSVTCLWKGTGCANGMGFPRKVACWCM